MAKNIQARRIHRNGGGEDGVNWKAIDANELKQLVRDGLVQMNLAEREEFIGAFEGEMRRAGLDMRAYLVPLGIPGRSPEDLTPTEVAHLMRFLKLNVPKASRAVESTLTRYNAAFAPRNERHGHRIAA